MHFKIYPSVLLFQIVRNDRPVTQYWLWEIKKSVATLEVFLDNHNLFKFLRLTFFRVYRLCIVERTFTFV